MLLVTEMKNQDPTAQTDPNQYVNQLVQVNSLEQLIEINENLTNALGAGTVSAQSAPAGARISAAHATASGQNSASEIGNPILVANPDEAVAGNLGISKPIPAAQRIAQALSGRR
jgi:flagellar basal-body rod modification protein FlgD